MKPSENANSGCVIVQSDLTVMLETDSADFEEARDLLSAFVEIVKCPEYVHTYKISQLSIWNAVSSGLTSEQIVLDLKKYARRIPSEFVVNRIKIWATRYGRVKLLMESNNLVMRCDDEYIAFEIQNNNEVKKYILNKLDAITFVVDRNFRGHIKRALILAEYPAEDLAGFSESSTLEIKTREYMLSGMKFELRPYQSMAVDLFHMNGSNSGGRGIIVLPCGAGKTIVGIAIMEKIQTETLIITTSISAVRQWINELLDKTMLTSEQIGEYSGEKKEIREVTVSTYHSLSFSEKHKELIERRKWGLIIYDEVHTLPAPVFRMTAELQSKRLLGLTATLVREDELQADVFTLVGPKRCDIPWKTLEKGGFIAKAECFEVRIPLAEDRRMPYAVATKQNKYKIAAKNHNKLKILQELLEKHRGGHILIIGLYLDQLNEISEKFNAPVITGKTKNKTRDELFNGFRDGDIPVIVVSKVANYAIDLPDANVAIEVSGTFGSRQEEAQRLGRILRPKCEGNQSWFYTLVTTDTVEESYASHRQLFLAEQGYTYNIIDRNPTE